MGTTRVLSGRYLPFFNNFYGNTQNNKNPEAQRFGAILRMFPTGDFYLLGKLTCEAAITQADVQATGYSGVYDGTAHELLSFDTALPDDGTVVYYASGDAVPFPSDDGADVPEGWSTEIPAAA